MIEALSQLLRSGVGQSRFYVLGIGRGVRHVSLAHWRQRFERAPDVRSILPVFWLILRQTPTRIQQRSECRATLWIKVPRIR